MKNLFLLSTSNPSRLYIVNSIGKLNWSKSYLQQVDGATNQHIYITDDSEIKEGDWIYSVVDNKIYRIVYSKNNIIQSFFHSHYLNESKKIILTTDQNLIADGVQAIDDTFLEWFVKNPSCESVEVKRGYLGMGGFCESNESISEDKIEYKIIIPKEELKQETDDEEKEFRRKFPKEFALIDMIKLDEAQEKPKQETIEQDAKKYAVNKRNKKNLTNREFDLCQKDFIAGAKWQAEQIHGQDYLQGFIDQFGDGELGEIDPKEWDALAFLKWLKLNNFEIIKKK
jgi:hypothetical protein